MVLKAIKGDIELRIEQDEFAASPREEFDNISHIFCFHRGYNLGDKHGYRSSDFGGWEDFEARLREDYNIAIIFPVYLYDHGGLRFKIGSFRGLLPQGHAEFDSGQVGFAFVTVEDIKKEYLDFYDTPPAYLPLFEERAMKWAEAVVRDEVKVYDQYLSGDVYSFCIIKHKTCPCCGQQDDEVLDSCSGFYGYDIKENGMLEQIPEEYRSLVDALEVS